MQSHELLKLSAARIIVKEAANPAGIFGRNLMGLMTLIPLFLVGRGLWQSWQARRNQPSMDQQMMMAALSGDVPGANYQQAMANTVGGTPNPAGIQYAQGLNQTS